MREIPKVGERLQMKEKPSTDALKELADIIRMPAEQYHYRLAGEWKPNQELYRVNEGDGVISDYSFPPKADMNAVQYASRKTYTKELNMWGKVVSKDVQFDRKTGKWKKLNLFQTIQSKFHKAENIPGQVVTEVINGKDVPVLHTLEAKRPVGSSVKEAELTTLQDARVELGLKYRYVEQRIRDLTEENHRLELENASKDARISSLNARLIAANLEAAAPVIAQAATYTSRTSEEPPSYGTITPTTYRKDTDKKPVPPTPFKKDEKLDRRGDEILRGFEETEGLRTKTAKEVRDWLAKEKTSLKIDQKTGISRRELAGLVQQSLEIGSIFYSAKSEKAADRKYTVETKKVHVKGEMYDRFAVVFEIREDCTSNDLLSNDSLLRDLYLVEQSIPEDRQLFPYQLPNLVEKDSALGKFPGI